MNREVMRPIVAGKLLCCFVEGDIARSPDGLGHQLLTGAGGAGDERGDVVHAEIQTTLITMQVMDEKGLSNPSPQFDKGRRSAHQVSENKQKGTSHLIKSANNSAGLTESKQSDWNSWK